MVDLDDLHGDITPEKLLVVNEADGNKEAIKSILNGVNATNCGLPESL